MGIIQKAASRLAQSQPEPTIKLEVARQAPEKEPPKPRETNARPHYVSKQVELNLAKLQEHGIVTPEAGRSAVAEEFRTIKRSLLDQITNQGAQSPRRSNLIMVTSCLAGEGKTFCAINLAMSIAMELDHTVLLIDADVARPAMMRTLGVTADAGLMDILLERRGLADVLLRTNVPTLSLLQAGASHRNATELLASKTMSNLLDEIASRYPDRVIIFDSPPLLLTSEARVLASQMGQIVMVVEAETTTQRALKHALRQIEGCPNVNLVYNKAKAFAGGDKYGYYAYYR